MGRLIPDKINNFNIYVDTATEANRLIGVSDEVTLPDLKYMSETLNLAGSGGEIDSPAVGQFQSMEIEIPFSNIAKSSLMIAGQDNVFLILRSAQEFVNPEDNSKSFKTAQSRCVA